MEQEKILEQIKGKLGQTNLSDITLNSYLKKNMPAEGVEPDDAYFDGHVDFLKTLNGNYSHDVAEQVKVQVNAKMEEFKKNYKPNQEPHENAQPTDLEKRMAQLEERLKDSESRNKLEAARSTVKGKAKELKVTHKALWDDVVDDLKITSETTEEAMLAEAKKTYESKLKAYTGNGAKPYEGQKDQNTESDKAAKERREAFRLMKQAAGKLPTENKN